MNFVWDKNKSLSNVKKHKISFEEAQKVFNDPFHLSIEDPDHSEIEERWITIGTVISSGVVLVVHTYVIKRNQESIRIISAKKATARERRQYFKR